MHLADQAPDKYSKRKGSKMNKNRLAALMVLCPLISTTGHTQSGFPDFTGMWSDAPNTLEGALCFFACFEGDTDMLYALFDDPANDETPMRELTGRVNQKMMQDNVFSKLSARGKENFPLDASADPGFTECKPWGFAREIFAPHQLRIEQHDDRMEMQYGEWDITRTVYMRGSNMPQGVGHTDMGYSVGHYEGDTLVIETDRINENLLFFAALHSEQLSAVERYQVREDGVLQMDVTLRDPLMLQEPIMAKKIWSWAPEQEIAPYDSCRIPDPDLIREGE